ncbi:hypothetical protein [Streptomyces fagopyri]|uniref:hypothetical protein n=1 Tax=Streptomyces fagopyri TaxID=2662397 RepID=UPI0033FAD9FB
MRHSPGPLPRRATVGRSALVAHRTAGGPAKAHGEHGSAKGPLSPSADDDEPTTPSLPTPSSLPTTPSARTAPSTRTAQAARSGATGPLGDPPDPSVTGPQDARTERVPPYSNTPGPDSDVRGPGTEFRSGGDQLGVRLVSQRDAAWVGALFAAVDAQR